MKTLSRLIIVLAITVTAFAASSAVASASQLIYSDEFNGTSQDNSVWKNVTPWGTDYTIGELERYVPSDVSYSSGNVRLTSQERSTSGYPYYLPSGFSYTSGIMTSMNRPKFSYGYFEVSAKLPKGPGIWPAFWLTNDSTLEIDALEMLGDRPTRIHQTLHQNKAMVYGTYHDGPDYSAAYHTYGVDWQPTYVKWYIDGVLTMTYSHAMPSDPLYICLNTAVGGAWPGSPTAETTFPVNYDINYVRVYDTKPTLPVAAPDAYSTAAGVTLSVPPAGVLANDIDPAKLPMTASIMTNPAHGTLSLRSDGSFDYTPYAGYSGTDSFKYVASDGTVASGAGTVSLTVIAPTTTVVKRPGLRKKSATSTTATYNVSGSMSLGTISAPVLLSYAPSGLVASTPVVLKVQVQRYYSGRWHSYRTITKSSPAWRYSTSASLRHGKFRVRSLVYGGGVTSGRSTWTTAFRVS